MKSRRAVWDERNGRLPHGEVPPLRSTDAAPADEWCVCYAAKRRSTTGIAASDVVVVLAKRRMQVAVLGLLASRSLPLAGRGERSGYRASVRYKLVPIPCTGVVDASPVVRLQGLVARASFDR